MYVLVILKTGVFVLQCSFVMFNKYSFANKIITCLLVLVILFIKLRILFSEIHALFYVVYQIITIMIIAIFNQ